MVSYWVVGAMFGGHDDQLEKFLSRGYWKLGWADADQPKMSELRDQMKPGDRIAIKRMLGQASPNISIHALGIINEIDSEDKRVYVDWLVKGVKKTVPSHGSYASIHGPFADDDPWVRQIFQI